MITNNKINASFFRIQLLHWHEFENQRNFPWVAETDPYKIWISEIMLQQTRAEQGAPYYNRFIAQYPTVQCLAKAPLEEVLLLWEGLGYYSRCRNLHHSAQMIVNELKGRFPNDYDSLLALKGVGPYTAAAIASFAYRLPHAVVDGNVYRVLARFYGLEWDVSDGKSQKKFYQLANELIDKEQPHQFNQAIMDFGATVCTPKKPKCEHCPLSNHCVAFQGEIVELLPIKSKKVKVRKRYFNFLVLRYQDLYYIQQRMGKDIWQGLFQFYLIETATSSKSKIKTLIPDKWKVDNIDFVWSVQQKLTHQAIQSHFFEVQLEEVPESLKDNGYWVTWSALEDYAFPKTIIDFIKSKDG